MSAEKLPVPVFWRHMNRGRYIVAEDTTWGGVVFLYEQHEGLVLWSVSNGPVTAGRCPGGEVRTLVEGAAMARPFFGDGLWPTKAQLQFLWDRGTVRGRESTLDGRVDWVLPKSRAPALFTVQRRDGAIGWWASTPAGRVCQGDAPTHALAIKDAELALGPLLRLEGNRYEQWAALCPAPAYVPPLGHVALDAALEGRRIEGIPRGRVNPAGVICTRSIEVILAAVTAGLVVKLGR